MAEKTAVDGVGPVASQLKETFSSLERAQLSAIKNMGGGAVNPRPGTGGSDVSGIVTRINPTQKSAMEIGANLAAKLERSGAVLRAASGEISAQINSTVQDKLPLARRYPKQIPDLSNVKNRVPDPYGTSVEERIKTQKESILGEEDFQYEGLAYPPDLGENTAKAWIELEFMTYTRGSPFGKGQINGGTVIKLPLPENLNVYHSIRYEERDTGTLGALAQKDSARIVASNATAEANKKFEDMQMKNLISGLSGSDLLKDAAEVAGYAAYSKLVESEPVLGGLAGQISGVIPNPHPTVFFKGVDLRQFEWTWHFVPRSAAEAARLKQIIVMIKSKILPKNGGNFMDYPDLIQPRVIPEDQAWGKFRRCAVKNFSINFTGEGTSAFFVNGAPVSVRCQMSFQEIEAFINQSEG